jgi:hypothetical protein
MSRLVSAPHRGFRTVRQVSGVPVRARIEPALSGPICERAQSNTFHKDAARLCAELAVLCALLGLSSGPGRAATVGQLQTMFSSLSRSRWIGADGAYSIPLSRGRTAWVFGDTVTSDDGGKQLNMVSNSLVVTGSGSPRVFINPIAAAGDGSFYWPGAGHASSGAHFWLLLLRGVIDKTGLRIVGTSLALMDANTGRPLSLRPVPDANGTIQWGSQLFDYRGYTYIYGIESRGIDLAHRNTWLHIARVPVGRPDLSWRYYTGSRWSGRPSAAARTLTGVSGSPSLVSLGRRGLRLVSQDGELGHNVLSWRAATPFGPFTQKHIVYCIQEMGPRTFVYLAHSHPQFSSAQATMFSFSASTFDCFSPANIFVYRPWFFVIPNRAL